MKAYMNNDELSEVVTALHQLGLAQSGQMMAIQTTIDALIATIGISLPPLIDTFSENLETLSALHKKTLEQSTIESYENNIAIIIDNLKYLRKS